MGDPWEQAYLRFETADQERRKFTRRLRELGARQWPRDARVVELFCGRGNGLHALTGLGFERVEGVDWSQRLLAEYRGPARTYVADCRALPLASGSCDIVIVQGGLHHLETLPADLARTLHEVRRVLRPGGRFVAVEPWLTPFLRLVHAVCAVPLLRRSWDKLDALATMIDFERDTYDQWLSQPRSILELFSAHFITEVRYVRLGKLYFRGLSRGLF